MKINTKTQIILTTAIVALALFGFNATFNIVLANSADDIIDLYNDVLDAGGSVDVSGGNLTAYTDDDGTGHLIATYTDGGQDIAEIPPNGGDGDDDDYDDYYDYDDDDDDESATPDCSSYSGFVINDIYMCCSPDDGHLGEICLCVDFTYNLGLYIDLFSSCFPIPIATFTVPFLCNDHCTNEKQDCDEENVHCGDPAGHCPPCACSTDADCHERPIDDPCTQDKCVVPGTDSCTNTLWCSGAVTDCGCEDCKNCASFYGTACGYNGLCSCAPAQRPSWSCNGTNCECSCAYDVTCGVIENCCNDIDDDGINGENGADIACQNDVSLLAGNNNICWWTEWDDYSNDADYYSGWYSCPTGSIVETVDIYQNTDCGFFGWFPDDFYIYDSDSNERYKDCGDDGDQTIDMTSYNTQKVRFRLASSTLSGESDGVKVNTIICSALASACSGNISLNLAPNPTVPNTSITASASGLSDCDGKTVNIKQNSCSGTQKCSCSASGAGCSCSFTAPSTTGNYTYYACIDKNDDSDYNDTGESDSEVLTVSSSCALETEDCSSISCCSSPPAPEPLTCVDNICRSCLSLICSADDAEDNSISEMGDSIDDVYCTWNIHDGCLVKEGVATIDGSTNPTYWEGEDCADSGSSDLWGEKKVYIDDINDYNIKGNVCVDDYNSFWINNVQVNILENGSTGCTGLQDVRSFFQTGWNTIKFKAVDTCSDNRYMDIDWEIVPRAPALNGNASSSSEISLSWSDRGSGVTYGLWNSDAGAYIYNGDQTSFVHTGLDPNATYSYQVIATKNSYDSDWSNTISVTTWNQPPVADAGLDRFVVIGSSVNLDGSGSYDPDGDPISYDWTFNSIPGASSLTDADFSDETIVNPTFTPDVIGVYLIELKVADIPFGGSDTDTVSITVADPTVCGDNNIQCTNTSGLCEECDGTDDALCPDECIAPGETRECLCPQLMPEWREVHPKME